MKYAVLACAALLAACVPPPNEDGVRVSDEVATYLRCENVDGSTFVLHPVSGRFDATVLQSVDGSLYPTWRLLRCERVQFQPGEEIK